MRKIDNSISLEEAAARRGVSKRRITQQVTEGGWGIRKIDRNQYVLSEDEKTPSALNKNRKFSDQYRLEYENSIRERLDFTQDPNERIYLICVLAEMEFDRLEPKEKGPEFNDEDRDLKDEEIEWLLSNCYQVGLISSKDLVAMGNSIKKSFEALKKIGDLNKLILEESAWSFMALDSIFGMIENRESRGDRRVKIAGNTDLPRKKSSSL